MLGVGLPPGIVSAHFHSALRPQTHPTSMSNVNIAQKNYPQKPTPRLNPHLNGTITAMQSFFPDPSLHEIH